MLAHPEALSRSVVKGLALPEGEGTGAAGSGAGPYVFQIFTA